MHSSSPSGYFWYHQTLAEGISSNDLIAKLNYWLTSLKIQTFLRYHRFAPDIAFNPILSFGSIIMYQIPLEQQTALMGRSIETVYVGRAPFHRGVIPVFNSLNEY